MSRDRQPGLPSLNEARADRRRQLATGKSRIGALPPQFFLWTAVIFLTFGIFYYRKSQSELEAARAKLMAKQRAVATTLGPKLLPIRDKVEAWAKELAGGYKGDYIARGLEEKELAETPGIYLRLPMSDAKDPDKLRSAAADSLRDAFTACLFRDKRATDPSMGKACERSQDCEPGELCNEYGVCRRPSQPFNMRLVYRALSVLSTKWTDEVHEARNEYAISAYEGGLDSVTRVDIPVAVDVFQRARFFTLVLDEEPKDGLPEAVPESDETDQERLQRSDHYARVGIWDLRTDEQLVRLRARATGELRDVGTRTVRGARATATRQRQVKSCGLALTVRQQVRSASPSAEGTDQQGTSEAESPEREKGPESPEPGGAKTDPAE